jgi:undecaprenyl phosphate N,N'-diacetylbacillosamine 1-phosphate transferase
MYKSFLKRLFDLIISLIGLIILSPVFLILTVLLLIGNKGQPFFSQPRPGKNEKIFYLIKFRTMTDERSSDGNLLPDNFRLTKIGSYVRRTSLDEIPQLINVIKGEMSLIGPRPLLIEYLALYNDDQRKRHLVRPGITGWAQINGRNAIDWQKKFEYDIWYVENLSFRLDFNILLRSLIIVIGSKGISSSSFVTMEKFSGN